MIGIARDVKHPSALSNALGVACYMLTFHRDFPHMLEYASEVKSFAREEGWELWYAVGVMSSGWSRFHLGDRADGLRELFEGVTLFRATRSDLMGPTVGVIHGEGLRDRPAGGGARDAHRHRGDRPRRSRRRAAPGRVPADGEIHLDLGRPVDAETAFHKALDTAVTQKALSLELRAAISYHECSSAPDARVRAWRSCNGATTGSRTASPSPTWFARARCSMEPVTGKRLPASDGARRSSEAAAVRAVAGGDDRGHAVRRNRRGEPPHPSNQLHIERVANDLSQSPVRAAPVYGDAHRQRFVAPLPPLAPGETVEYTPVLTRSGLVLERLPARTTRGLAESAAPVESSPAAPSGGVAPRYEWASEFLGAFTVQLVEPSDPSGRTGRLAHHLLYRVG